MSSVLGPCLFSDSQEGVPGSPGVHGPLVRPRGGSIELQSCDFPHCYVSLKEILIQTHKLNSDCGEITHLGAVDTPAGILRLQSGKLEVELKLHLRVHVLPLPAL